jgi:hypothetical protein
MDPSVRTGAPTRSGVPVLAQTNAWWATRVRRRRLGDLVTESDEAGIVMPPSPPPAQYTSEINFPPSVGAHVELA